MLLMRTSLRISNAIFLSHSRREKLKQNRLCFWIHCVCDCELTRSKILAHMCKSNIKYVYWVHDKTVILLWRNILIILWNELLPYSKRLERRRNEHCQICKLAQNSNLGWFYNCAFYFQPMSPDTVEFFIKMFICMTLYEFVIVRACVCVFLCVWFVMFQE